MYIYRIYFLIEFINKMIHAQSHRTTLEVMRPFRRYKRDEDSRFH